MANFTVDPHPFVPPGFVLQPRDIVRETSRMRCFLPFTVEKTNEDLAIALTEPKIAPNDFWMFARALRHYLLDNNVRALMIQQCPRVRLLASSIPQCSVKLSFWEGLGSLRITSSISFVVMRART
ncbi:unnamed protein product [Urochloa humidicola]